VLLAPCPHISLNFPHKSGRFNLFAARRAMYTFELSSYMKEVLLSWQATAWAFAVLWKKSAILDCCFVVKMDLVRGCSGFLLETIECVRIWKIKAGQGTAMFLY